MEFVSSSPLPAPKNLYPCLAAITIHSGTTGRRASTPSEEPGNLTRVTSGNRLRTSFGPVADRGAGDSPNVLTRVLSGNTRHTSFGPVADRGSGGGDDPNAFSRVLSGNTRRTSFGNAAERFSGEEKRKSLTTVGEAHEGTWYWRVQAGASDSHLILLPLSQPPNSLLTSPPAPLSSAMPAHSQAHNASAIAQDGDGFIGKVKNVFRRNSSSAPVDRRLSTGNAASTKVEGAMAARKTDPTAADAINDQTGSGQQMPDARANTMGATNLNANAELGWPGTINGEKLGAVIVNLGGLDKAQVKVGGKKNEAAWVTMPITAHSHHSSAASHNVEPPKNGTIRFEFDKDWIGAKGEAEILHHQIVTAIENASSHSARAAQPESVQLGGTRFVEARDQASSGGTAPNGGGGAADLAPPLGV